MICLMIVDENAVSDNFIAVNSYFRGSDDGIFKISRTDVQRRGDTLIPRIW